MAISTTRTRPLSVTPVSCVRRERGYAGRMKLLPLLLILACGGDESEPERQVWRCEQPSGLWCQSQDEIAALEDYGGGPCKPTGEPCECADGLDGGCPADEPSSR